MHIDLTGVEIDNIITTKPNNSQSFIKLTSFINDTSPYPLSGSASPVVPYPFISIIDNDGVNIYGCKFINNQYYSFFTGIWIDNSDVRISSINSTIGNWGNFFIYGAIKNIFKNLTHGIWIIGNSTFKRSIIENTLIEDMNLVGIGAYNTNNSFFLNNSLNNINSNSIELLYSTGYEITQNTITHDNIGGGILVHISGEDYNEIYNNKITNATPALKSYGQNRSSSLIGSGLKFLCNNMHESTNHFTIDILVDYDEGLGNDGIATYQGGVLLTLPYNENNVVETKAAGNKFDNQKLTVLAPLNVLKTSFAENFNYIYGSTYNYEHPSYVNVPLIKADY